MKSILLVSCAFLLSVSGFSQTGELLLAIRQNETARIKQLISKGADVNAADSNLATMLMWAVYKCDLETVQYFVGKKAIAKNKGIIYLNAEKTAYYGSPVAIAAGENKLAILKYLLENCKINIEDKEYDPVTKTETGWTALQWAASNGHPDVAKYLIAKKANINANHTPDKGTPLIYALQQNKYDVATLLIEKAADINLATNEGTTALMLATLSNNLDLCILLWQHKADPGIKNGTGKTAMDFAKKNNYKGIIDFFTTPGDYKNIQTRVVWTDLNKQVVGFFGKREFEKAVPIAEKALTIAQTGFGDTSSKYLTSLGNLAILYRQTKQTEKAESLYIRAKEITRSIVGENHPDYASTLSNLASLYEATGQYEKAEPLYVQAKEIRKKVLGETHPKYIQSLNNLASIYESMGQYEKAEPFYLQVTETWKTLVGETHADYASSLNNLAGIYKNMGQYEKAEPLYIQAKEIFKKTVGEKHLDYTISLNNLAGLYQLMGQYEKAEPLYIQVKEIRKNLLGENHLNYASSLNNLGGLYKDMGEYEKAEPLYLQAREIWKNLLGENHPEYATSLNNIGTLYVYMGQYEKAEALYIQAKVIREKMLGVNHPDYAISLNNLATLYQTMGQYEKAEPLSLQVVAIMKIVLGKNHPNYATSLNNLGMLYKSMGRYEKAESFYIQAKNIRKQVLGESHPDYATSLNNLATLYQTMGQYEKAEPLLIQAKDIIKNTLGEDHPDLAASLNNLGSFYKNTGRYEKAEPFYLKAQEIRKRSLGKDHPDVAASLNNLGELYQTMGQYEKAKTMYSQAMEIWKILPGETHPGYVNSLNNLASIYQDLGQYDKAEPLYIQAKELKKKLLGEVHPLYALSLINLGTLYQEMDQYEKAEALYIQAKDIYKTAIGENHADYALSLNNLANLNSAKGQFEKAASLYIQAKEIYKIAAGEQHPEYASSLDNLATLYSKTGQFEKAEPLILQSSQIVLRNLLNNFTILSEKEKGNYLSNNISQLEINNSFLYNYKNASPSLIRNNFNQQLVFKSLTLTDTRDILTLVQQNADTAVQRLLKNWLTSKSILSKQYALPVANRMANLVEIEMKTENLEKELNRASVSFRKINAALQIKMESLQQNMQQDEVAIEFVSFLLYNKKWTDSTIYAAYILRKNDSLPVFIPLCEEKQLEKILSPKRISNESIKALYRSEIAGEEEQKIELGDSLYALIWKPFLPYLKDIKKIDYSPAGLLYKVAFHALPTGDSQLLLDKYELRQYTSLRRIAEDTMQIINEKNIVLFGDCAFTMDSVSTASAARVAAWKDLPGTAGEIKAIGALFDKNKITTVSFSQQAASEENLKSISGNSPAILHLATHGFFLPDPEKKRKEGSLKADVNVFASADDPLLRSGIVLAGVNSTWNGQSPIPGREDGIVTAYEISQLDLGKTNLVVLSACETALGDIKGNEGVFGLQRAFKLAGVKNMLLSLWRVPDAETAELMTIFYNYYIGCKTVREAFNAAQKDMRAKYKPYYWAAFVLIE